ncbi:GerMN domain-containing protein [Saccharopolyspora sp. HNM0983]|uniref:GerMN domain-containing protein n=1 Tax=Saccharopolyspora montiporae TaxID=2781240 RepID=A0A929BAJ9_9PSEU|nr:LpqB family beta-propeller domain-containing protein [Saccharopolyspora sp. HNM0983]MBE9376349.1 GerMN domain-containing protein [Saccharopolyspora sp. HNM0983]
MSGRVVRGLALLVVVLLASGCAAIPESSDPKAVEWVDEGNTTTPINPPPSGTDPLALVRSFVDSTAAPASNHKAARLHLSTGMERNWQPEPGMLVVDNVDTIPAPQQRDTPRGVQLVSLQADKVGRLLPDQSFQPETGEYRAQLRVEQRPDGEWRITEPPPGLVVSENSFSATYRQVPVYFLDHDSGGVVPDLRYVVSQPVSTLPGRVIDLLTSGPSERYRGAVNTAIPEGVHPKTNTSEATDGALEVNLSELGEVTPQTRKLVAAQVVYSLQSVSSARVRLKEEGMPLLPDAQDLRPTDVAEFEGTDGAHPDAPALAVVDERLVYLDRRANPVPGPAGSGEYDVLRAGLAPGGDHLSAVTRVPDGVELRVGGFGSTLSPLGLRGNNMSKPSWRGDSEVWTAVDGRDVVRVRSDGESWSADRVDVRALTGGEPIADLRVSPDGTRVAAVVGGKVAVSGIDDSDGRAVLREPNVLSGPNDTSVTGVEWRGSDSLVVLTDSNAAPVFDVSADGYQWTPYTSANLGQPLSVVTVDPGRRVIVADRSGLWEARDTNDVWGLLQVPIGGGSIPFFPG